MTVKKIILLACLCAALSGCGAQKSGEADNAASPPAPVLPEQSQSETIDPYEKAATLSAPEESSSSEVTIPDEAGRPEGGELPLPSSVSEPGQGEPRPEESSPAEFSTTEPSLVENSGGAQRALSSPETSSAPVSSTESESRAATRGNRQAAEFTQPAGPAPQKSGVTDIEQALIRLINDERSRNGMEALGVEDGMQLAAGIRAREALQSLSHTRPDGTPYYTTFDEAGFSYAGKWHGENLAMINVSGGSYDEAAIADALFRQWLESPGHQQNMLGDSFLQTGVGVYVERDGDSVRVGAAQLFAGF